MPDEAHERPSLLPSPATPKSGKKPPTNLLAKTIQIGPFRDLFSARVGGGPRGTLFPPASGSTAARPLAEPWYGLPPCRARSYVNKVCELQDKSPTGFPRRHKLHTNMRTPGPPAPTLVMTMVNEDDGDDDDDDDDDNAGDDAGDDAGRDMF